LLKDKVSAFTGNSGVGKSSIINKLLPQLELKTGDVSEKLGRGRHTTRYTELFKVNDGYVADTPGFSSLDIEKTMTLKKENLQYLFPEFEEFLGKCKFTSCSHIGEKGCAISAAVEEGRINHSRIESYRFIYNEIKDIKQWEK
jgi:ribosome biogenesis GTPase